MCLSLLYFDLLIFSESLFNDLEVCAKFDALIIRCNPGQINQDGGDQKKFDDAVRALQKKGIQATFQISIL